MDTITERTKSLLAYKTSAAKRFKELEEITKIPSGTWRTWWNKNSKPSGEMIEAIARTWPECAFWLATGITDSAHGHIGINAAYEIEINLKEKPDQISSIQYIRQKNEIYKKMLEENRSNLTSQEISEIYNYRCARDSERLGYLTRNSALKKGEVVGYFDPRLLKNIDQNNE